MAVGENRYFREALADFVQETAYGGAVRHLADRGYTVAQIMERLEYPAPCEKVRRQRFCPSFCFCPVLCPGLYLIMSQSRGTCNAFLPAFYLFQLFRHSFRVHSIPFRHIPSAFRHIPARFLRKNGLAF